MRISDWSSDVCSSDLLRHDAAFAERGDEAVGILAFFLHAHRCGHQAHACVVSGSRRRSGGICDQIKHIGNSLSRYSKSKTGGPAPISAESANGYDCCSCRRSEEHTSELQSLMRISYAVFCLKKKNNKT